MCGIAGIIDIRGRSAPPSLELLRSMAALLAHRGPDGSGLYRDRHASLVHTRLSIIDLDTGQQPICNEDGTLWIVFNGEVFNYLELRSELAAKGHSFRTDVGYRSDSACLRTMGRGIFSEIQRAMGTRGMG